MTDWGPEGYCKHCNRMCATRTYVVKGKTSTILAPHTTGYGPAEKKCAGSDTAPTKRVPKESRNHRFSYTPKKDSKGFKVPLSGWMDF